MDRAATKYPASPQLAQRDGRIDTIAGVAAMNAADDPKDTCPGTAPETHFQSFAERSLYAPSAGHRAISFAMTTLLFVLVVAVLLVQFSRTQFVVSRPAAPVAVNLMTMASPQSHKAAEEKPVVQKKAPRKVDLPRPLPLPKPAISLANAIPIPPPLVPAPAPAPKPVEDAAPPTIPAPPAPQVSSNSSDHSWQAQVLARLGKYRRYPSGAQNRHEQGVPYIRFVMDRDGKVLSSQLERSSGFPDLDREAVALAKRAQPLPKPPMEVKGDTIELVVPVEFFLH